MHFRSIIAAFGLLLVFCAPAWAQEFHWERTLSDSWLSIAFNPLSHGRVIFAGPANTEGIFRSDDGGKTWIAHDSVILADSESTVYPINHVDQIFVVPGDTNIVLAATEDDFYRSTDGGVTWWDVFNYDPIKHYDTLGAYYFNFGGIADEAIAYNSAEDALYYGEPGTGVWRSTDHGADWTLLDFEPYGSGIGFFSMDVSQDVPPLLLQSTEVHGGIIARSTDLGQSWETSFRDAMDTVNSKEFPKIVFSWNAMNPATGKHEVAVAQRWPARDSNTIATTDGGLTWKILPSPSRVWGLDIDQRREMLSQPSDAAYPMPLHFFTGLFNVDQDTIPNGMVQETTDGGSSWHSIGFPKGVAGDTANPLVNEIWVLKYDTASGTLAVATDSGIYIGYSESGIVNPPRPPSSTIHLVQDASSITLNSVAEIRSLRVFDIIGREVFAASPGTRSVTVLSNNFPAGMYGVEAFAQTGTRFFELISLP